VAVEQALVLVTEPDEEDALEHPAGGVKVVQRASSRVALVEGPVAGIRKLAALPGVEVIEDDIPDSLLEQLSRTEALFARAWERRQHAHAKERPGEGLAWDAPGFEPPDAPRDLGG
jgi:hypothetical protein